MRTFLCSRNISNPYYTAVETALKHRGNLFVWQKQLKKHMVQ